MSEECAAKSAEQDNTAAKIPFSTFAQVELRVAQIEQVEEVPGSNKLYKLQISLGSEEPKRQLVSGIKKFYTPEDLLNKKIIIVSNLEPAKIMGLESQGMLLAAEDPATGVVSLLQTDQNLAPGSKVR
jgi:methionyl-tRNA synthetase